MFILNKKRVYMVLTFLIVATVAFEINILNKPEVQETVALPANKKVVILDAGHRTEKMVEQ